MTAQPLPALASGDPSAWDQALYAFLVEKGNRSGSRRTVESYSRMLWPFFAERSLTPDRVKPGDVLGWVHGIGRSGRTPSSTTVGARIACFSSFYRFLTRMGLVVSNPTDAVERPRSVQSVARGHSADEVRRLLAVVPDTVAGRRDAGESIEQVSAFLDHSCLAVTTVCLRRLEGEVDRAWRDVAEAIGV
jgi:site-specific recombinase XerD